MARKRSPCALRRVAAPSNPLQQRRGFTGRLWKLYRAFQRLRVRILSSARVLWIFAPRTVLATGGFLVPVPRSYRVDLPTCDPHPQTAPDLAKDGPRQQLGCGSTELRLVLFRGAWATYIAQIRGLTRHALAHILHRVSTHLRLRPPSAPAQSRYPEPKPIPRPPKPFTREHHDNETRPVRYRLHGVCRAGAIYVLCDIPPP
ncbi:hypothetical protein C8R45DRAFT_118817 [Mycena sanguinolenta]|nr:hypothetical protein C8R45DRAFT_118817 [Mycena sanguinolenta]